MDHQLRNLVTDLSKEDESNILNTVDLRKASNNDKRRPNKCISQKLIENYEIPIRSVPRKASYVDAIKNDKKKVLIIDDSHVRRINREKL